MNKRSKVLKSGLWYVISNVLVKGIGFLTTPVFSRLLTQSDYGYYSNFASVLNVTLIICSLNLGATFISAKFDYKDRLDEYISSVLLLGTVSIGTWMIIYNLIPDFFTSLFGVDRYYFNVLFIYIVLYQAIDLFQMNERYAYRYKRSVCLSLIISLSTAAFSVFVVSFCSNNKLLWRINGQLFPTIFIGLFIYIALFIKGKKVDFKIWKYALAVSIPYIPHLLSITLLNSMDQIMISKMCGTEQNAIYSMGYTCGIIISMFSTAMNGAFSPWLGERLFSKEYERIKVVTKKYMIFYGYLLLGIALVAPEVLMILGGDKYGNAKFVIPPVLMGCCCQFIYTFFASTQQFARKTIGLAVCSITAASINFITNYYLIPQFGYMAAAYTTFFSLFCLMVLHMLRVYQLKMNSAFDYFFIVKFVITLTIIMIIINLIYSHTLTRIGALILYASFSIIILIKKKKNVISIVNSIIRK